VQVAEQAAGLALSDVHTGEVAQVLGVVAAVPDGDVDPELVRAGADR
jgi:hypothetical protein